MLDPLRRWRQYEEKPDYAGLLSFGGAPYTEDPSELAGVDVAVVGAPMDDLVSDRPGARLAPRAIRAAGCPPGPHLAAGIDAFAELKIIDFGDAAVVPGDPETSHRAIEETVGQVVDAGALPVVLGGDHGVTEPALRACARRHGPLALVHFDAHTDTGEVVFGVRRSHGTPMRHLVDEGHVEGSAYVQIGLRGYWPGEDVFAWQRERGITSFPMHEVRELGWAHVLERTVELVGSRAAYLSVDIDCLEPGLLGGGTGTPEPGGMATSDLLDACRHLGSHLELAGLDIVEVIPRQVGSADVPAVIADRVVREALTGVALRRRAAC